MNNTITITDEHLQQASIVGEKNATEALSALAKRPVEVLTRDSKKTDIATATAAFEKVKEHSVIAYTSALTGISGIALLALDREHALNLVDLFNNRPPGSTVVMQELDRSTIRETLNILSNSYITELARVTNSSILLSVPSMVTSSKMQELSTQIAADSTKVAVLFETSLKVSDVDFQVQLFFFFITSNEKK